MAVTLVAGCNCFMVCAYCHYSKYSLVSITFSFRPNEAMSDLTLQKLVYYLKSISVKEVKESHINNWIQLE